MSNKKNKNLCIIQARMGSTRLPNKVLMEVEGIPLLEYEIRRVRLAKKIDKIVVATGLAKANDEIEKLCQGLDIDCFRGSEDDVLDRYEQCSLKYPEYSTIIRLTGDCPLIDPQVIDVLLDFFEKNRFDYAGNVNPETFPDGIDVEVFTKRALSQSAQQAKLVSEREHVTQYILKNNSFRKGNFSAEQDWSHIRLTVDYAEDFEVVSFLIKNSKPDAGYLDYVNLLEKNPKIMAKNREIIRNLGLLKSLKEDKLYGTK